MQVDFLLEILQDGTKEEKEMVDELLSIIFTENINMLTKRECEKLKPLLLHVILSGNYNPDDSITPIARVIKKCL